MAMANYDSLTNADQAKIDAIVHSSVEHISNDGVVDIDLLMALLERLNDEKRKVREEIHEAEKKAADANKKKAAEIGKSYVQTLHEGDMITFNYGPAKFMKQATLPIEKIGAATVQVIYTPDMLGENSQTARRNVLFDKIVVPAEFLKSFAA